MYKLAAQGLTRDSRGQSYVHVTNAGDASRATPMTLLRLEGGRDGRDDLKVEVMPCTMYNIVNSSNDVKVIDNIEQPVQLFQSFPARDFTFVVKASGPTGDQLAAVADFSMPPQLRGSPHLYYKCRYSCPDVLKRAVDTNKLSNALEHWWTMNTKHSFYATYLRIFRLDLAVITSAIQVNSDARLHIEVIELEQQPAAEENFYPAGETLPNYKVTGLSKELTIPPGATVAYQYTQIKVNAAGKTTIVPRESCGSVGQLILAEAELARGPGPRKEKGEIRKGDIEKDCALVIFELVGNNEYRLVEENLHKILDRLEVKGLPVCVLSIAGAFRTGKTFVLNFFLKYLHGETHDNTWLTNPSQTVAQEGLFEWKGGTEAHTMGIHMWSRPFVVERSSTDKVAVLLMDTQGTFDHKSSSKSTATIFALSTLVSSLQIYNVSSNIGEDSLRHLEYFAEYGKLAIKDRNRKPFQNLMFLVRDHPKTSHLLQDMAGTLGFTEKRPDFGAVAGEEYLKKVLKCDSSTQSDENKQLRDTISCMFDLVTCFLLPRPGGRVMDGYPFDYARPMKNADNHEFLCHIQDLVYSVLSPNHLVIKEQNGIPLTSETFLLTFKKLAGVFTSVELPEIKTVLEASADADNMVAAAKGKDVFVYGLQQFAAQKMMDQLLEDGELEQKIGQLEQQAIKVFNDVPKIGGEKYSASHLETLKTDLESIAQNYRDQLASVPSRAEARRNCEAAVAKCISHFNKAAHEFKENAEKRPTLEKERVQEFYATHCIVVQQNFKSQPKLGNESVWKPYVEKLQKKLEDAWKPIVKKLSTKPTMQQAQDSLKKAQKEAEIYFRNKLEKERDSELEKKKMDIPKFKRTVEGVKQKSIKRFKQSQKLRLGDMDEQVLEKLASTHEEETSESISILEKCAKITSRNLKAYNFCFGQYVDTMDTFLSKQRKMETVEETDLVRKYEDERDAWRKRMLEYDPSVPLAEEYLQRFDDACQKKYQEICQELEDKPTKIQLEQANTGCVRKCYKPYKEEFSTYIDTQINIGVYCPNNVEMNHKACEKHALKEFETSALLGGSDIILEYKQKLQEYIDQYYHEGYRELKKAACTEDEAKRRNKKLRQDCYKNYLKGMRKEAHYSWQERPIWTTYQGWFENRHPGISGQCLAQFDAGRTGSYEFSLEERNALKKDIDYKYSRFVQKDDAWFNLSSSRAWGYYKGSLTLEDE